ncbi:hypothetical protein NFI96_001729 [Prochilodus magdalenae]|nr:hypothetical protein NFI96_001729 [Prochilodus magdalenae]
MRFLLDPTHPMRTSSMEPPPACTPPHHRPAQHQPAQCLIDNWGPHHTQPYHQPQTSGTVTHQTTPHVTSLLGSSWQPRNQVLDTALVHSHHQEKVRHVALTALRSVCSLYLQDRTMNDTLTNSTDYSTGWHFSVSPFFTISMYVVNFFLGFPLNVYILVLYFPSRGVMDGSDVFTWNQAVVEMLFVLLGPFQALCSLNLCLMEPLGFLLGTFFSSRCVFPCCVCLERYLAVVHPVTFLRYKPLRYRVACSVMAWMCSLANGAACSYTFPYLPYQVFSAMYLLILTVDVFCCVSILRRLKDPGPRGREGEEVEISTAKRKAFLVVSVNLLLLWTKITPVDGVLDQHKYHTDAPAAEREDRRTVEGPAEPNLNMNSTLTTSTSLDFLTIFIISSHTVNFLLGLTLNLCVLVLLFPGRGVKEASDVFSWNQAVSDMFFLLIGPSHILCSLRSEFCSFHALGFSLGISLSSRCLFQSCVCLERYLAVVHPVTFLRYKPLRYRVGCSITVWVCSVAIAFIYSWRFPNMPYDVFSAIYLLVLIVDVFCCVSILRKLRDPGPRDMERDAGEMNAAKKKAFQVVCVNLLAFLIQNVPIYVGYGLENHVPYYDLSSRCLFHSCVCVERYLAVVHPVTFLRYKPLRYRVMCSIAVWICSLAIAVTYSWRFPYMPYDVLSHLPPRIDHPEKAEGPRPERHGERCWGDECS